MASSTCHEDYTIQCSWRRSSCRQHAAHTANVYLTECCQCPAVGRSAACRLGFAAFHMLTALHTIMQNWAHSVSELGNHWARSPRGASATAFLSCLKARPTHPATERHGAQVRNSCRQRKAEFALIAFITFELKLATCNWRYQEPTER